MRLGLRFLQGIDFFIGESLRYNTDTLFKARLLAGIILSFIVSVISFAPFFVFLPGLPDLAVWSYFIIAIPLLSIWCFLVYLLHQGKAYHVSSHLSILSLLLVLYGGIAITGGPLQTEVHPLLIIPVIAAFLLLGDASGRLWTLAIGVVYFSMLIASYSGVEFINLPADELSGTLRVFNWSYAFITSALLVFIYDLMSRKMMLERDEEREKLEHIANVAVENSVMTESANALTESGEALLDSAIHQKQSIESLASTTEELSATADQNSQLAHQAMSAINDTDQHVRVSKKDLLLLVSSMQQVQVSSQEIQNINNVINDIAYQTNLLSLNAMIEASRSNENGGFKVVALEVRKLAERSADAAAEINDLLSSNLASVQQGVHLSETMEKRFNEIALKIKPLVATVQQVADASSEQNSAIHQITQGLLEVDKVIEENKNRAHRSSSAAKKLRENSNTLIEMMMSLEE